MDKRWGPEDWFYMLIGLIGLITIIVVFVSCSKPLYNQLPEGYCDDNPYAETCMGGDS